MTYKFDLSTTLHKFVPFVENLLFGHLKIFRSGGSVELCNSSVNNMFTTKGILHKKIVYLYTLKQNGVIELKHKHYDKIRAQLPFRPQPTINYRNF